MAIEQHKSKSYYYRKHRINGRVVSEYIVGGAAAPLWVRLDALKRAERQAHAHRARAERDEWAQQDALLNQLEESLRLLVRAHLLANGYHLHKGQWRKTRVEKKHVSLVPINAGELGLTQPESQKLSALIKKTQLTQPAPADLQALREMLHDHPQLWQVMGDLVDLSVQIVLGTNNWLSQGIRVSVEAGVRALKQELGYRDAPALEKILIDQIIVTWLQLNKVQIQYETAIETGLSLQSGYWWEHRLSAANARYFRACDTLARVRKLSRPTALQLNIGARQLNLASTSTPPTPAALPSGADDLQA